MTEPRPIHVIAGEIREVWTPRPHPYAAPYLDAMLCLNKITDYYISDPGKSVVAYFLANAGTWKGEDARRIKAELRGMIK